jgi:hypothetical protein
MPKGILICDLGRVKSVAALCNNYGLGIELQGHYRHTLAYYYGLCAGQHIVANR